MDVKLASLGLSFKYPNTFLLKLSVTKIYFFYVAQIFLAVVDTCQPGEFSKLLLSHCLLWVIVNSGT